MVQLFAELKALETEVEFLKKELLKVQKATLQEEGCKRYTLYQSVEEPQIFRIHECFSNQEAFDQHLTSIHFQELQKNAQRALALEPQIKVWKEL